MRVPYIAMIIAFVLFAVVLARGERVPDSTFAAMDATPAKNVRVEPDGVTMTITHVYPPPPFVFFRRTFGPGLLARLMLLVHMPATIATVVFGEFMRTAPVTSRRVSDLSGAIFLTVVAAQWLLIAAARPKKRRTAAA